jgi:hypothetical protein
VECFVNCCSLFIMKWFYLREETARPIFMQLAVFTMPKKQHLEKKFTRRIMRSAIRLSVLDFS